MEYINKSFQVKNTYNQIEETKSVELLKEKYIQFDCFLIENDQRKVDVWITALYFNPIDLKYLKYLNT